MSIIYFVAAFIIATTAIGYKLYERGYLPNYLSFDGPFILIHSRLGFGYVEKIAEYKRFWRTTAWGGVLFALIGMLLGFIGIVTSAASVLLSPETTQTTNPQNYLAIPGVNDFLPLSVGIEIAIALLVGAVLHEAGHAILCRVEDIELESTGIVFLSLIPMGAFVEPDEASKNLATRLGRVRMAAAGILQNLFLTAGSILLVVLITSMMIVPASGAAINSVYDDSPADNADITGNQLIVSANGQEINSNSDLQNYLESTDEKEISVQTKSGETATISRSLFITGVQSEMVPVGKTITSVNNEEAYTREDFQEIARDGGEFMNLTIEGQSYEIPAGVQVQLQNGNLGYVTQVDGERVVSASDISNSKLSNSESITFYTSTDGEWVKNTGETTDIQSVDSGVAGIIISETGLTYYPTEQYLGALQFDSAVVNEIGFMGVLLLWFMLPLATLLPGFTANFPGFSSELSQFFTVTTGPENVVFFIATTFFWMAWMNFNLAFFNSLPIWMLDGHHILKDLIYEADERLDERFTAIFEAIYYGIPFLALLALVVIIAAPVLVEVL